MEGDKRKEEDWGVGKTLLTQGHAGVVCRPKKNREGGPHGVGGVDENAPRKEKKSMDGENGKLNGKPGREKRFRLEHGSGRSPKSQKGGNGKDLSKKGWRQWKKKEESIGVQT